MGSTDPSQIDEVMMIWDSISPLKKLTAAATVGWVVGTKLDDLLGSGQGGNDNLSDDVSDYYADNYPAPGWLQDLF